VATCDIFWAITDKDNRIHYCGRPPRVGICGEANYILYFEPDNVRNEAESFGLLPKTFPHCPHDLREMVSVSDEADVKIALWTVLLPGNASIYPKTSDQRTSISGAVSNCVDDRGKSIRLDIEQRRHLWSEKMPLIEAMELRELSTLSDDDA
jgi:hypothetical protein